MDTNKILIGGLIGFAISFFLGFLFYGVLLMDFFAANEGSATGVARSQDDMLWVPMVLGHLALGLLLAIILGRWAQISTFSSGAIAGAVIGLLMALTFDLIMYGNTNVMNLTGTLMDIVVVTVTSALTAGAIGMYYGTAKKH